MFARLSAFVIWGLVAATAVFWGLRLMVRPMSAPSYAVTVGEAATASGDLGRVLGSTPANGPTQMVEPAASSRFRLLGIVAPRAGTYVGIPAEANASQGVALIAVDGKMPKAFAVGSHVDGDLVLQSVSLRTVALAGQGSPAITLQLPPPTAAATGSLPGARVDGSSALQGMTQMPQRVAPSYNTTMPPMAGTVPQPGFSPQTAGQQPLAPPLVQSQPNQPEQTTVQAPGTPN